MSDCRQLHVHFMACMACEKDAEIQLAPLIQDDPAHSCATQTGLGHPHVWGAQLQLLRSEVCLLSNMVTACECLFCIGGRQAFWWVIGAWRATTGVAGGGSSADLGIPLPRGGSGQQAGVTSMRTAGRRVTPQW